jgi:heme-degrading monooxygenase HmoA
MNLIVRVLKGRVQVGQVAVFREQAQQALDDARLREGLVYAQVGRQAHSDGGEEIVFVSVWRDLEALYSWVGGTDLLETPVLSSGSFYVFDRFEVQHYETYEPADGASTNIGGTLIVAAAPAPRSGG